MLSALAVLGLFSLVTVTTCSPLRHGWKTTLESSFADFGYSVLTTAQAADVASHYKVVGLEKCTGNGQGFDTVAGIYENARLLKLADASVKVFFYMSTINDHLQCYYSAYAAFLARPDWWLRDDAGNPINVTTNPPVPVLDYSNSEARAWWRSIPLGGANTSRLIDGLLADQAGLWACGSGVSASRCSAINKARSLLVREAQDMFTALNNGTVLQNGISMYASTPDYNMYTLPDADGIMAEHFASFESIVKVPATSTTPVTFHYDYEKVGNFLGAVRNASAAGKMVVLAAWPGPIQSITAAWPSYANNLQPTTNAGWRDALVFYRHFALAGWATVASETVFLQYMGWYNGIVNGVVGCGGDTSKCATPLPWYDDVNRPLGAPLGPAVPGGNVCTSTGCFATSWTRQFEFATSYLDLVNPNASGMTWYSTSSTPSASASPTQTASVSPSPQATPSAPGMTTAAGAGRGLSVAAIAAITASMLVVAVAAAAFGWKRLAYSPFVSYASKRAAIVVTTNPVASHYRAAVVPSSAVEASLPWREKNAGIASSSAATVASSRASANSWRMTAAPASSSNSRSGQLFYV